jgi:hypothetical protein
MLILLTKKILSEKKVIVFLSNIVVVPSEEAGDGFGQVQSVSSHKVRKDALHLPKPSPTRI